MLKPNHYYWIVPSNLTLLNLQVICITNETGELEKDLYYHERDSWKVDTDEIWYDVETELRKGYKVQQQWSSKEEMLADMFVEFM